MADVKIYTRGGDKGETGLFGGRRVPKDSPRVSAYGDVDELNCALGAALAALAPGSPGAALEAPLRAVQRELFVLGALLAATPDRLSQLEPLPSGAASRLEREIDAWTAELEPMTHFILPGGGAVGAALHLARAVCRRAERAVVALSRQEPVAEGVVVYLNRLSDHLFTAARWANAKDGRAEIEWKGHLKK